MHYLAGLFVGLFAWFVPHHQPVVVPEPIHKIVHVATTSAPVVKKTVSKTPAPAKLSPEEDQRLWDQAWQSVLIAEQAKAQLQAHENDMNLILQRQQESQDALDSMIAEQRAQTQQVLSASQREAELEAQIRAEVTQAGGFATESQIRAMALSRM